MLGLRARHVAWAAGLAVVGALIAPAAAHAAPLTDVTVPFGLFGISIKEVVGKILRSVVSWVVPDFARDWPSQLVTYLVAVPNVTRGWPSLRDFHSQLVPVGIGLVGFCFVLAALEYLAAGVYSGPARAVDTFGRTVLAVGVIVFLPLVVHQAITAVNILTAELISHRAVRQGINQMLGAALVLATVGGALSLGIAVGAALLAAFFLAALLIFKVGDTTLLAVLYVAAPIAWGLYPLRATRWVTHLVTAGLFAALLLPVAWALIFATAGLLGRDAFLWTNPALSSAGLADEIEALVRPLAAVACLWVAYKAPALLMAAIRQLGVSPAMLMPGGGWGRGGGRGPAARVASRGLARGADRFRALRIAGAHAVGRTAGYAGARASVLRNQAAGRSRRAAERAATPAAAPAAGVAAAGAPAPAARAAAGQSRGRQGAVAALGAARRRATRAVARTARGARAAADWWRKTAPAQGAAARRAPDRTAVAAFRAGRDQQRQRTAARLAAPQRPAAGLPSAPAARPAAAPAGALVAGRAPKRATSTSTRPPRPAAGARPAPATATRPAKGGPPGGAPLPWPRRALPATSPAAGATRAGSGAPVRAPSPARRPAVPAPAPAPAPAAAPAPSPASPPRPAGAAASSSSRAAGAGASRPTPPASGAPRQARPARPARRPSAANRSRPPRPR